MLKKLPLGQQTIYVDEYSQDLLFPVQRSFAREKIGLKDKLPFDGVDLWTGFEISWLNAKGKPEIALADFSFPCTSPNIVESKSFKLYLNSLNQTSFKSFDDMKLVLENDLAKVTQRPVQIDLYPVSALKSKTLVEFSGICLDTLDIETNTYQIETNFLQVSDEVVKERLYSDLLKSNCLATGQPDWGSLYIHYLGPKRRMDREGLLK